MFTDEVRNTFFADALKELRGPRPSAAVAKPAEAQTVAAPTAAPASKNDDWAALIGPEAIEDEIKTQQQQLAASLASAVKFKGGAYRQSRQQFSMLATLFAIAAQYDGQIRWKQDAAALRDRLSRAGFNCKVGTDQAYQEARARHEELASLLRGDGSERASETSEAEWDKVADRAPLMQRLETAVEGDLSRWTANAADFERHLPEVEHNAQLVAALSEVIVRGGYEFADDDTYREYAATMRQAAQQTREAAEHKDYDRARVAVGELKKSCSNCHEGFRN